VRPRRNGQRRRAPEAVAEDRDPFPRQVWHGLQRGVDGQIHAGDITFARRRVVRAFRHGRREDRIARCSQQGAPYPIEKHARIDMGVIADRTGIEVHDDALHLPDREADRKRQPAPGLPPQSVAMFDRDRPGEGPGREFDVNRVNRSIDTAPRQPQGFGALVADQGHHDRRRGGAEDRCAPHRPGGEALPCAGCIHDQAAFFAQSSDGPITARRIVDPEPQGLHAVDMAAVRQPHVRGRQPRQPGLELRFPERAVREHQQASIHHRRQTIRRRFKRCGQGARRPSCDQSIPVEPLAAGFPGAQHRDLRQPVRLNAAQFIDIASFDQGGQPALIEGRLDAADVDPSQTAFSPGLPIGSRPDEDRIRPARPPKEVESDVRRRGGRDRAGLSINKLQSAPPPHPMGADMIGVGRDRLPGLEHRDPTSVRRHGDIENLALGQDTERHAWNRRINLRQLQGPRSGLSPGDASHRPDHRRGRLLAFGHQAPSSLGLDLARAVMPQHPGQAAVRSDREKEPVIVTPARMTSAERKVWRQTRPAHRPGMGIDDPGFKAVARQPVNQKATARRGPWTENESDILLGRQQPLRLATGLQVDDVEIGDRPDRPMAEVIPWRTVIGTAPLIDDQVAARRHGDRAEGLHGEDVVDVERAHLRRGG